MSTVSLATDTACSDMRPPENSPYKAENAMMEGSFLMESRQSSVMLERIDVTTVMLKLCAVKKPHRNVLNELTRQSYQQDIPRSVAQKMIPH